MPALQFLRPIRKVPLAWRMLVHVRTRLAISIGGVAFTVVLMLFLFGIHDGVKQGATAYVSHTDADIWVCQRNATNLLRSSSFLRGSVEDDLLDVEGVASVTALLRMISTARIDGEPVTIFLFGYDPESPSSRPPAIRGTAQIGSGEMVIDRAFARKHRLAVGDSLYMADEWFRIAGISRGTNTVVAQFAFTTLDDARRLAGFSDLASFFLIRLNPESNAGEVIAVIEEDNPSLAAFSRTAFIENNLREMQTGMLPVLWTIAVFGTVTGLAVLTLILYAAIVEKKDEYALLKAVGAGAPYLVLLVVRKSIAIAALGYVAGVLAFLACVPVIGFIVPEIDVSATPTALSGTLAAALFMGLMGGIIPVLRLQNIFPAEVFRA